MNDILTASNSKRFYHSATLCAPACINSTNIPRCSHTTNPLQIVRYISPDAIKERLTHSSLRVSNKQTNDFNINLYRDKFESKPSNRRINTSLRSSISLPTYDTDDITSHRFNAADDQAYYDNTTYKRYAITIISAHELASRPDALVISTTRRPDASSSNFNA